MIGVLKSTRIVDNLGPFTQVVMVLILLITGNTLLGSSLYNCSSARLRIMDCVGNYSSVELRIVATAMVYRVEVPWCSRVVA